MVHKVMLYLIKINVIKNFMLLKILSFSHNFFSILFTHAHTQKSLDFISNFSIKDSSV